MECNKQILKFTRKRKWARIAKKNRTVGEVYPVLC